MNPELLEQRKDALFYNQGQVHLITNLCEPLKSHLDIDFFVKLIVPLDSQGQAAGYCPFVTDTEFLGLYMDKFDGAVEGRPFLDAIQETSLNSYSYFLWPNGNDCLLIQSCLQKIGLARGLTIYKRCSDRMETWWFASKNGRRIPYSITQESISVFQKFVRFFDASQTSNHLLRLSPLVKYPIPINMAYNQSNFEKNQNFEVSLSVNKFILNIGDRSISLSKREWECLSGMAQGKTYKGVANTLSLSPRTVETYLNQIREKAGITSKAKLVDYFLANNQFSL
ncbi:MAG: helix-turn-helix transcriptional regulator [Alphaproteobacteria bacterium]|nr:helix-turn-helix transcriptional regulator [Alphaproteobacteria bacterium]